MITLLAIVMGLLVGSFLNVCIYRWPLDLSVRMPSRSFCPQCEQMIAWYDNIPVLSFLLLRGRCRHCHARIRFRYPLVELLTGVFWGAAAQVYGLSAAGLKFAILSAFLVALFFSDLEERILPDEFTKTGVGLGILFAAFVPVPLGLSWLLLPTGTAPWIGSMLDSAIAALFFGAVLWGIGELYYRLRHREGLGLGDVKLIAMVGAFLGLQGAVLTLLLGSLAGSVLGLLYITITRQDSSTYELPFGSFLCAAGLLVATYLGPNAMFAH